MIPQGMAQPTSTPTQLPPWLQKVGQVSNNVLDRLGGQLPPGLNPQEQSYAQQQQRMSMIRALLNSAQPRPVGTSSPIADLGNVVGAGQQAGQDAYTNAMKMRLMQAQMAKDQYREVPAGGTLLGPDNKPVYVAPAAETGINSRFRTPQVLESGRVGVIDGQTGRLKYADSGQDVPQTDPVSAHLQVITLPDGSMQIVDMRRGLGGASGQQPDLPVTPRSAPLVSPDTALTGAGNKARVTAQGGTEGTAAGTAVANLPQIQYTAQQALDTADKLINHPGRETATGVSGVLDPRNYMPGTDAKNFAVLLNQAKGQVFLDAYQALKGGGPITDIEGVKAEQAKARMDTAQSDDEFMSALYDYKAAIKRGLTLAQKKTQIGQSPTAQAAPDAAIQYLKQHPETADAFKAKFGYLP